MEEPARTEKKHPELHTKRMPLEDFCPGGCACIFGPVVMALMLRGHKPSSASHGRDYGCSRNLEQYVANGLLFVY